MAARPRTVVSLFSGIGALDLAVRRVFPDVRCQLYVEREAYAVAVLAARMADGSLDAAPVWSDVTTIPTGALRGRVDMVVGGFPCTDISLAGKGAGLAGEASGLFFALADAVRDLRPRYVFLENVAALTLRGLDAVLGTLAELGFDAEWGCLRASDVGAPHQRNRWWCLAWDRELVNAPRVGGTEQPFIDDERWALGSAESGADGRTVERSAAARVYRRIGVDPAGTTDLRGTVADGNGPGLEQHGQQNGRAFGPGLEPSQRDDAGGRHQVVADAVRLQRPGQGRGLRDGRGVREVRQAVADASSERRQQDARGAPCHESADARRPALADHEPSGARADVAVASDGRRGARLEDAHAGRGQPDDAGCRTGVGNACRIRDAAGISAPPAWDGIEAEPTVTHHPGHRAQWPGFPPGPGDRDGWRAFLEAYPDLAPATPGPVDRGAVGLALSRLLRGVVPAGNRRHRRMAARALAAVLAASISTTSVEQSVRGRTHGASERVDQLRGLGNAVVPAQAEAALRVLWWRAFGEML